MVPTNKHPTQRAKAGDDAKDKADPTKGDKSQSDGLPAYSTHAQDTQLSTSASSSAVEATNALTKPCLNPTNFVHVNHRGQIKCTYVIDPSLQIPNIFLPLIKGKAERNNNVSIKANTGCRKNSKKGPKPAGQRTMMYVGSTAICPGDEDHSVTVKINAIDNIAPFWLSVSAVSGCATVLVPRSFHGPIALEFKGRERGLSDEIFKNSTQLTTIAGTRMFFVGDYSAVPGSGSGSAAQWAGDQLNVENPYGWVRVKYVDEVDQPVVTPTKRGVFNRLFRK